MMPGITTWSKSRRIADIGAGASGSDAESPPVTTPGANVGRVFTPTPGSTSYLDTTATSGTYGYRIQAVAPDGHVVAQSAYVTVVV